MASLETDMTPSARRPPRRWVARWTKTVFDVRRQDLGPVLAAVCGFFFVLTALMLLRPVRDAVGMAGGMESVRGLFITTALVTLALNPVFSLLVARVRRAHAIAMTYGFFGLTLLVLWALMTFGSAAVGLRSGQAFYVWFSVLNVFGTMVFWALVSDRFTREQGTRLFALVGVGGTLGAIFGAWLTSRLAHPLGASNLLPLAAMLLVLGIPSAWWLIRLTPTRGEVRDETEEQPADDAAPMGGGAWDGAQAVVRSPYLAGIAGYVLLMAVMTTLVYLTRLQLVAAVDAGQDAMAALLANIDMWTQLAFLVLQLAMATRIGHRVGPGHALVALPMATALGFAGLAAHGGIAILYVLDAANRAVQRGVARPARELLFTHVRRGHKYKARAFIDTFVYRLGDVLGAQIEAIIGRAGTGPGSLLGAVIPLTAAWALLAIWLGRRYRKARQEPAPDIAG